MTTREALHKLIDELPECDLHIVESLIEWRHDLRDDPMLVLLATAPLEDEEITPEEEAAVAEAREEIARGEVYALDEVKRELGL